LPGCVPCSCPPQKIGFVDDRWFVANVGEGIAEAGDAAVYGDHEGGQRVISRFALRPRDDDGWIASAARHWNIDRDDPR
jgi:hypothetical protein